MNLQESTETFNAILTESGIIKSYFISNLKYALKHKYSVLFVGNCEHLLHLFKETFPSEVNVFMSEQNIQKEKGKAAFVCGKLPLEKKEYYLTVFKFPVNCDYSFHVDLWKHLWI